MKFLNILNKCPCSKPTPLIVWIFCNGVTGRMALEPAALTSAPILLEMQFYAPHILICRMESLGIGLRKPL